ncbi:MAG: hypothetical protein K2X66_08170 [Cyanobacteria bacterium]|nr:hypothetical protein [Cyanobacteriota bacterium]
MNLSTPLPKPLPAASLLSQNLANARASEPKEILTSTSTLLFQGSPMPATLKFSAAKAPQTPAAPSKSTWQQCKDFFIQIKDFCVGLIDIFPKLLGLFDGLGNSLMVLKHAKGWQSALSKANPESTLFDRSMALLDITYSVFRESVQKTLKNPSKTNAGDSSTSDKSTGTKAFQPNEGNFFLYMSILNRFPGLLRTQQALPGDINLVQRAVENYENPDWSDADRQGVLQQLKTQDFSTLNNEQCMEKLSSFFPS